MIMKNLSNVMSDAQFVKAYILRFSLELNGSVVVPTDEEANQLLASILYFCFKYKVEYNRANALEYLKHYVKTLKKDIKI